MDTKKSRRIMLTTIASGLAFFGLKKIIGFTSKQNTTEPKEGSLVLKPRKDAVQRLNGGAYES